MMFVYMELDQYRIKPMIMTKQNSISRGLGGKNAVRYFMLVIVGMRYRSKLENTKLTLNNVGTWYVGIGRGILHVVYLCKLEEKIQSTEDMGQNLANVHPRVQGERHVATGYDVCCDSRGRPGIHCRDVIRSYIPVCF